MPETPEVYPLPVIVPNHEAFTDSFLSELRKVGCDAESLEESAERAINLIDNFQRQGLPVCEEHFWDVILCVEAEDGEALVVSDSAMKLAKSLYGKSYLNGRMSFFTVSEAIAVGRCAAQHWACTDECDIDGEESRVVVAVVQGVCGHEPDIKALNNQWQHVLGAECSAGFLGEVDSWVF